LQSPGLCRTLRSLKATPGRLWSASSLLARSPPRLRRSRCELRRGTILLARQVAIGPNGGKDHSGISREQTPTCYSYATGRMQPRSGHHRPHRETTSGERKQNSLLLLGEAAFANEALTRHGADEGVALKFHRPCHVPYPCSAVSASCEHTRPVRTKSTPPYRIVMHKPSERSRRHWRSPKCGPGCPNPRSTRACHPS
jgi:hypothetical protein